MLMLIGASVVIAVLFLVPRPLKIGYCASLSGLNSELGISGRNGALLAVTNINSNGGINGQKVVLVSKDDMNDVDTALAVDKELYDEGVNLIIGHMTSQMAVKTVPYINDNQILMISPTIAVDSFSGQDDFFFRVIPSNKTQAKAICDDMISDGVLKIGVIIDKSNLLFAATLKDFFIDYFEAAGGEIMCIKEFEQNDVACEECISNLPAKQIDGIFVIAAADSFTAFSQKLLQLGLHTNLYGPAWAMTEDLLEHGGSSLEGAQFVNYFNNSSSSADFISFREQYLVKYGDEPSFAAFLSYEAVTVLVNAIEGSDSTIPEDIAAYIKNHKVFQGLEGSIEFDRFGDVDRQLFTYKITDGQFLSESQGNIS